jgi:L-asparaginase
MTTPNRPRVEVLALGGTIAMTEQPTGGVVPAVPAEALLAAVPGLDGPDGAGADLRVRQLRQLPGASLTLDDVLAVAAEANAALAAGAAGVVVIQGTDTIEESAFLLDLLHDAGGTAGGGPVVVTGAMRNPTQAGADGPANLAAAVRVAASPAARGLGCVVVLADEIHAARWVRKTHTSSVAAFASPFTGPIGGVAEGRVTIATRPVRFPAIPFPANPFRDRAGGAGPRVGVYPVTLGDDGEALAFFAARCDGLVVAGFGVGHVPVGMVPVLAELAGRMPVVLASRTGAGTVHGGTYGFPGSERDLVGRGLIPAGHLDPYKARLLLYLLLAGGIGEVGEVGEVFGRFSSPR